MKKATVVIDIVGLSEAVIGVHTPFLQEYIAKRHIQKIRPVLPALTTSAQTTYLTGKWPSEHGIVGNGWYNRKECEVQFWKQANPLVEASSIWDAARKADPEFTCSQFFWWYNMYNRVDFSATPRPNYLADGRKIPDFYTHPADLRDTLRAELGPFPLFQFWGPGADIRSSEWIARAAMATDRRYAPTLTFIYLPHLDYCQQKYGPDPEKISRELHEIDQLLQETITYYQQRGVQVILLSEYGINPVHRPIHINRHLRRAGWLQVRRERGLELLDAGASKVFAVADHQIAHVYVNDPELKPQVAALLEKIPGIARILDKKDQQSAGIAHERAGDFVLEASPESWFTYYFWLDDALAPDYARSVNIHKKPGYDPVEMFMSSRLRAGWILLKKKLGFRYVMDIIPLDASRIKGSHGSSSVDPLYYPVLITDTPQGEEAICPTEIYQIIWSHLFGKRPGANG